MGEARNTACDASSGQRRVPAWSWLVHGGLVVGAAWLTAAFPGRGGAIAGYIGTAAPVVMAIAFSIAVVLILRGSHSRLFRGGFLLVWAGMVSSAVSARVAKASPSSTSLAIASILLCLSGTVALVIETRRLGRGAHAR